MNDSVDRAWPFGGLSSSSADVISADPPWSFRNFSAKGHGKGAHAHYQCMSLDDIKAMPVRALAADSAWLFLWTSAPMLDQAFDVMKAWGFTYKSRIAWRKMTVNGKVRFGPGYVVRTMHEDVLIGTIGKPARDKAMPSIFDGLAREHSRKPDEFYAAVERFAPAARKLDLFSRESRPGWAKWGDQSSMFDEVGAPYVKGTA
jgi:N6-adenosine-specific RNA methylase IME4